LLKFLWVYGDYGYVFPDRETAVAVAPAIPGFVAGHLVNGVSRHYWTATGGVELTYPNAHRVVPFLRLGGGEVHQNYNFFNSGTGVTISPQTQRSNFGNIAAGTVGGGVRLYLGDWQGLKVEVDEFFLGSGIDQVGPASFGSTGAAALSRKSGGRVTIGYFRQFGRR
jgi:hypothetical protein